MAGARYPVDHRHDHLEFDLVVRGSGSYSLDAGNIALKPGTLVWLVPGTRHRLVRSPNLEMWVVNVRPDLLDPARIAALAAEPSHLIPGHELIDLDRLLGQVAQDSDEPAVYNAGIAYLTLRAWRASRESPPENRPSMHPAVTRALLLLRERHEATSLAEIAAAAGVTAPYLSRLLVEHTGRSFVEWRNGIRLDRFMSGYRPGVDLTHAAHAAGFGSYARFNRVFAEIVGCPPSEWVRRGATPDDASAIAPYAVPEYGPPPSMTLSMRQRWTRLIPLVVPAAAALLGGGLLMRLGAARKSRGDATASVRASHAGFPARERERFVGAMRTRDPAGARELSRIMEAHDFAATFADILNVFDFSSSRFADGIAALLIALWTATNRARDPSLAEAAAVRRQVEGALTEQPPQLDRRGARDAQNGLMVGFVVVYHAVQATRAGGDPHAFTELASVSRRTGREVLGGDLAHFTITDCGLARRSGRGRVVAKGTRQVPPAASSE